MDSHGQTMLLKILAAGLERMYQEGTVLEEKGQKTNEVSGAELSPDSSAPTSTNAFENCENDKGGISDLWDKKNY